MVTLLRWHQKPSVAANNATTEPILTVDDFTCFVDRFASGDSYANCDGSTTEPILTVDDFTCFVNAFAQGCL